jgi:hypothetical protein
MPVPFIVNKEKPEMLIISRRNHDVVEAEIAMDDTLGMQFSDARTGGTKKRSLQRDLFRRKGQRKILYEETVESARITEEDGEDEAAGSCQETALFPDHQDLRGPEPRTCKLDALFIGPARPRAGQERFQGIEESPRQEFLEQERRVSRTNLPGPRPLGTGDPYPVLMRVSGLKKWADAIEQRGVGWHCFRK